MNLNRAGHLRKKLADELERLADEEASPMHEPDVLACIQLCSAMQRILVHVARNTREGQRV